MSAGNVWLADGLVTSLEIMPHYVAYDLGLHDGGNDRLRAQAAVPVRVVEAPCQVAAEHGVAV